MRTASLPLVLAASLVAVACQPNDLTNPGGGPGAITARITATDVSRPSGPAGSTVTATGTVTFTGLTVELWNGQQWLTVANGSGSATVNVGDGSAAATLVPASEIPAGDYSKARVSATSAAIDITLDGQGFSARVENPNAPPLVLEKTVSVTVNPDGSRTFRIELQFIRTVSLGSGTSGPVVQLAGDLGTLSVPAVTAPAAVLASDVSQPTDASGARVNASGTVTFSGLTVELWDGQQWLTVADGSGSATVNVGDGSAAATLVPASEIPAGAYSKARVSATSAAIDITLDGQGFSARLENPNGPSLVLEKTVSVTVNPDGSRTFRVELQLIRTVTLGSGTSGPEVQLAGDLGVLTAPAVTAPARVLAADVSEPTDASGAPVNVTGTVTFSGLTVELWDGQQWLSVANGSGSAAVAIGDGTASATLVPAVEIAAGLYTKVRIGAAETVAQLTAVIDGQEFAAQIKPPADRPFVIEKEVTVTVNADGSRTFQVQLQMVRTVTVVSDPTTGVATLSVTGDLAGTR